MKDLTSDSLAFLSKVLVDSYEEHILIHIAQTELSVFSFRALPDIPTSYGYVVDRTPLFLSQLGVLSLLDSGCFVIHDYKSEHETDTDRWKRLNKMKQSTAGSRYEKFTGKKKNFYGYSFYFPRMKNINESNARGLYYIVVSRKKAEEWVNNHKAGVIFPVGAHHFYNNGILYLKLADQSHDVLDLSKADTLRPIFESFYFLYLENGKKLFAKEELLQKHKQLTQESIDWETFGKRKSSIYGKMVKTKPVLKSRIVWEFDRREQKFKFEILPLSSAS